jgi:hypothetical protein
MSTFIDAVNRVLRTERVIRGDDDNITTFSDTQHSGDVSACMIAIQDEIAEIASEALIPYEHTTATIALVSGQRSYALETDFIRFFGKPSFYDSVDNRMLYEYPGGEANLMQIDYLYNTTTGTPTDWYYDNTTSKKVAFYYIPDSTYDGRSLTYHYEKSIMVESSTDTMPFHNNEEFYAFCSMASRRFRFMIEGKDLGMLAGDSTYNNAKSRLYALLSVKNPRGSYGKRYC